MERSLKRLIKWLYFKYVYPDEMERVCQLFDAPIITVSSIEEVEWVLHERHPNERVH